MLLPLLGGEEFGGSFCEPKFRRHPHLATLNLHLTTVPDQRILNQPLPLFIADSYRVT